MKNEKHKLANITTKYDIDKNILKKDNKQLKTIKYLELLIIQIKLLLRLS